MHGKSKRLRPPSMVAGVLFVGMISAVAVGAGASGGIGDTPAIEQHIDQADILAGKWSFDSLFQAGKKLFEADFNRLDGAGRPTMNGTGTAHRSPRVGAEAFNRISGPDSNACVGCHNKPRSGGGGDNVANVFVLGQRFGFVDDFNQPDPVTGEVPGTMHDVADERNTLGMWGSGAIEMLAREMTGDLLAIRARAIAQAKQTGAIAALPLTTKGVGFGSITARPDGSVDTSAVEGVDNDPIIKPFHQKGVVVSLRQFTVNAFNHHHGMEAVERFGLNTDPDGDGVTNELTVGDVTATTIFQAALAFPGRRLPRDPARRAAVGRGEQLFAQVGCASCHLPALELKSPIYTEPNPYNPTGNLQLKDVPRPYSFDLTRFGELPRPGLESAGPARGPGLRSRASGSILVRAFTDLKRHNMGNDPRINNEHVMQNGVPMNVFITKKLWGFASEAPFLHNGCATLIGDAIDAHGGEAQASRDAYAALPPDDRASLVEYLKTFQVLPPGTTSLVIQ